MYHGRWAHFGEDAGEFPALVILNVLGVIIDLVVVTGTLIDVVGGNARVSRHTAHSIGLRRRVGGLCFGWRNDPDLLGLSGIHGSDDT